MRTLVLKGFIGEAANRNITYHEPVYIYQKNHTNVAIHILHYNQSVPFVPEGLNLKWALFGLDGQVLLKETPTHVSQTAGVFSFELSVADTDLPAGKYYHEARLEDYTLFVGPVGICPITLEVSAPEAIPPM